MHLVFQALQKRVVTALASDIICVSPSPAPSDRRFCRVFPFPAASAPLRFRLPESQRESFMRIAHRLLLVVLIWTGLFTAVLAQASDDANVLHFENHIRPVLADMCFRCHGGERVSGALRVDSREALLAGGESGATVVPGHPEQSLLIRAIRRDDDVSAMPPENDKALRADQVAAFETWIRDGAVWPKNSVRFETKTHWAFEPIRDVPLPAVKDAAWTRSSVDHFVRAKQEAAGVAPAPQTDKRTLIRRASFDLTGLPPTPDEVADFEADSSPEAFRRVIDRLLSSPRYGERWGRHWLDVVRYADTAGETADYPVPVAWRYRNYVIDAFNADKPYDQFLREQIAGDILAGQHPGTNYAEQVTATGYLAISRRFGFDSENYHHLTIQDTIDTLGQSVLGLSLGCARCHDHKFDPITMTDYYGLYGIFDSSRYSFPGSEQKQRFRTLAPLLPPAEAASAWRAFDQQVGLISASLEARNELGPAVILRPLNDMDGDFELQAPAAGGSNGVLVAPWQYEGRIAVTTSAQSPFRNLYARGKVGASIDTDAGPYRIVQALPSQHSPKNDGRAYVNLDFRMAAMTEPVAGGHRIQIGKQANHPVAEVLITASEVRLLTPGQEPAQSIHLATVRPGTWQSVQLELDPKSGTVTGRVFTLNAAVTLTSPEEVTCEPSVSLPLLNDPTAIGSLSLENVLDGGRSPGIEYDNLAVQNVPIPPASTRLPGAEAGPNAAELTEQLQELVGIGGDFELQTDGTPPAFPWNPGPNSVVQVAGRSQSPFRNRFTAGARGVFMPNRGEYDGFGLTLPTAYRLSENPADSTELLHAAFDFRCADITAGGDGSWRFYLGHGPGNSAAIELFFNGRTFFRRSGDTREAVCDINPGDWYQVQITLNLKSRTFTGSIHSDSSSQDFSGDVAAGWDGVVDYSFIDSYGHLPGVRPAIDVDNYDVSIRPLAPFDAPAIDELVTDPNSKFARAQVIHRQLAELRKSPEQYRALLEAGPFPMAYAMAEGTPHDVAVQLRGEPSQPGERVARGFVRVLGGQKLDPEVSGSGRLQLAEWLTSPGNPLTARVMVNRIWQHHFGQGLVKTPNDFGVRGLPPTHPELLDHLATRFERSGWSIKEMHRLIMLSAVYQQSAQAASVETGSSAAGLNGEDLYDSFRRRRLSAEEIRDAILFVTGELDSDPGEGHPFPSPVTWGFTQHGPFSAVYDHNKRSVYLMTQRLKRHPFLALFDGPDPNASTADRLDTTVPTQALFFLNDAFVHSKAERWAERLMAEDLSAVARTRLAFRQAFGREPLGEELTEAEEFLTLYQSALPASESARSELMSLAAWLRSLIGSNEFLHVD
jgi:hypothetical protein